MKRNSLIVLAIVAAVVIVLASLAVRQRTFETKPSAGGGLMYGELLGKVNSVASIRVNNGSEIFTISRGAQGWGIAEKSHYPVKYDLVKKMIMGVAELDLVGAKTKDPSRHGALGLNVPEAEEGGSVGLVLLDDSGETLASLLVGRTERAGGARRYVRRPDENQTWLSSGGIDPDRKPLDWTDMILTQIRHDRIRKVEFMHPDGDQAVLERMDQSGFNFTYLGIPEGMRTVTPTQLNSVAGALAFLNMKDVRLAKELDFGPTKASIAKFETWDGIVITVSTIDVDDNKWARFDAQFDESLVVENTPPADSSVNESDEEAEEVEDPHATFREEAATISARTQGWAYVLDDNKMEQLRRRNEDLIEPDTPDEKDETGDLNTNQ